MGVHANAVLPFPLSFCRLALRMDAFVPLVFGHVATPGHALQAGPN